MNIQPSEMLVEDLHFTNQALGSRIKNVLGRYGIETLGQLLQYTEENLLDMHHFGTASLSELTIKLKSMGLELKTGGS